MIACSPKSPGQRIGKPLRSGKEAPVRVRPLISFWVTTLAAALLAAGCSSVPSLLDTVVSQAASTALTPKQAQGTQTTAAAQGAQAPQAAGGSKADVASALLGETGEAALSYSTLVEQEPVSLYPAPEASKTGTTKAARAAAAAQADGRAKALAQDLDAKAPAKAGAFPLDAGVGAGQASLAAKYFVQGFSGMDAREKAEFWKLFPGVIAYDNIRQDKAKAKASSLLVATAVSYLDKPNFILAVAAGAQALDPGSSLMANNFAGAIVTAGERLHPLAAGQTEEDAARAKALAPYRADAESAYRCAVALSLSKGGAYTQDSIEPLVNLGYLLVDEKKPDEAEAVFLAARGLESSSWKAAKGLAACYIAGGKSELAKAALEQKGLEKTAVWEASDEANKEIEAIEDTVEIPLGSSDEVYADAVKRLSARELSTSADFVESLDQSDRNKMKYELEHLPAQGSYQVPPITMVAQFSSLKAMHEPAGVSALKDFGEAVGNFYSGQLAALEIKRQLAMTKNMGIDIKLGFDPADAAAHPEKYENYEPDVQVTGADAAAAKMDSMAKTAEKDLARGKTASTVAMAAAVDPIFKILLIDPRDYADPYNIIAQKYNFSLYNAKSLTYKHWLYSVNKRTYEVLADIGSGTRQKVEALKPQAEAETAALQAKYEAAKRAGVMFSEASWRLRFHAIHEKYFRLYNEIMTVGWNQSTQIAATAYLQKIKPAAEGYYHDVIRHVAFISDPNIREDKDIELKAEINQAVAFALQEVLAAFGGFDYKDNWDCDCDVAALVAQREREQVALDREEEARVERNKAEKKRFDSKDIPESSPLFKRLDSYGADLNIPFIPFLSGRISEARTVVRFQTLFPLPIPGMPSGNFGWSSNNFTGTTTYSGGVSAGLNAQEGNYKVGAKLGLDVSWTTDGNGVVSDYSIKGSAALSAEGGGGSVSAGGSLTTGSSGSDLSGQLSATLNKSFAEGTLGVEGSVSRGCSLSGKVEATYNQAQEMLDEASKDYFGKENAGASPTKDLLKKTIWEGKFEP